MYGKLGTNRPKLGSDSRGRIKYQLFAEWVQEMSPGLPERSVPDAVWFATNSETLSEIPAGVTDPICIKRWFNEHQATKAIPLNLLTSPPPSKKVSLTPRGGEQIVKLMDREVSEAALLF